MEDMLPAVGGIGIPVLLGLAVFFATVTRAPVWILTAVSAGALEEALSAQPAATAVVFFVALATAVRFFRELPVWMVVAYPAYRVWLGLAADDPEACVHVLLALPVGILSTAAVFAVTSRLWRKAGADE